MTVSAAELQLLLDNDHLLVADHLDADPDELDDDPIGQAIANLITGERMEWTWEDWESEIDELLCEEGLTIGELLSRYDTSED